MFETREQMGNEIRGIHTRLDVWTASIDKRIDALTARIDDHLANESDTFQTISRELGKISSMIEIKSSAEALTRAQWLKIIAIAAGIGATVFGIDVSGLID